MVVVATLFITIVFLVGGLDAVDSVHRSVSRSLSVTGNLSLSRGENGKIGVHKRTTTSTIFPEAEAGEAQSEEYCTREDQVDLDPAWEQAESVHGNAEGSAASPNTRVGSRCCGLGERLNRWVRRMPLNKVKILVVVWQILAVFPTVSGVDYPPIYSRFLSWIDAVNLDLSSLLSTSCILPTVGWYQRLMVTTLTPLALVAVLALTYHMAKHRAAAGSAGILARKAAWSRHMAVGLLLTFLVSREVPSAGSASVLTRGNSSISVTTRLITCSYFLLLFGIFTYQALSFSARHYFLLFQVFTSASTMAFKVRSVLETVLQEFRTVIFCKRSTMD